jgi:broad specificity phosphatase PhoE
VIMTRDGPSADGPGGGAAKPGDGEGRRQLRALSDSSFTVTIDVEFISSPPKQAIYTARATATERSAPPVRGRHGSHTRGRRSPTDHDGDFDSVGAR